MISVAPNCAQNTQISEDSSVRVDIEWWNESKPNIVTLFEYNCFKHNALLTYFSVQKESNEPCNRARIRLILQRRYRKSSKPALRCFCSWKYCSLLAKNDINWLLKLSLICVVASSILWLTIFAQFANSNIIFAFYNAADKKPCLWCNETSLHHNFAFCWLKVGSTQTTTCSILFNFAFCC